ncbi:MAG: MFS transporter, partial [Alphaproteobacteria bacterium]
MPLLLLLGTASFVVGIGAFAVIGVLPLLSADFGLGPVGASWVMTSYALAYAVGSPLLTSLSGRFTRQRVLVGGMLVFSCGLIGTAFAPSAEVLYAARVVTALGAGIVSPGAAAVAVASVPPERRGQALSIAFGGITLSQVVGVPASSYLGYHYGWPSVFVFMTAAAVAMAIALWLKVPSDLRIAPARLSDLVATLKDFNLAIAVLLTATVMGAGWIPYTFLAAMVEEKLPGTGAGAIAVMLVAYGVCSVLGNAIGGKI